MSSFQVDGLISGLKTADIVAQLMTIERRPVINLQNKQTVLQKKLDALKDIATRMSSLRATLDKLSLPSTFGAKKATTDTPSSSPIVLTATANANAAIGSFRLRVQQLATSTVATSVAAIGQPINTAAALADAGFAITPTGGFFTVNGEAITIDPTTTTLNGGAGSVVDLINAKSTTTGVTASVVDNKLVLMSASPIRLGSGADTSNFLAAAKVLAAPDTDPEAGYRVESLGNLGVARTTATLSSARLATEITTPAGATTGTFKINGVEFTYDTQADSLSSIISRINASSAGVITSYDAQSDRLVLVAKSTGSVSIALEDGDGSNFLAATGLLGASQVLGQNAIYEVDNGTGYRTMFSASNTIAGVVPDVTVSLKRANPGTEVAVTIEQDASLAVDAIKSFIEQYNSTVSLIRAKMSYDAASKKGEVLLGDSTVQGIEARLRSLLFGFVDGVDGKLADIGISTGTVGGSAGSAGNLVLDETKLTAALQSNPAAVARIFFPETSTAIVRPGGTGSIAAAVAMTGVTALPGTYQITSDSAGNLSSVFTPVGGTAEAPVTGVIAAGGVNSTLIRGLTLRARDPLVAGTDVIEVSSGDGVASRLKSYLDTLISANGTITTRRSSEQAEIARLGRQIAVKEDLLADKEERLILRFAKLESSLARLQSQSGQVLASLAGLTGQRSD